MSQSRSERLVLISFSTIRILSKILKLSVSKGNELQEKLLQAYEKCKPIPNKKAEKMQKRMEKLHQQDMEQFEYLRKTAPRIVVQGDHDGSCKNEWSNLFIYIAFYAKK